RRLFTGSGHVLSARRPPPVRSWTALESVDRAGVGGAPAVARPACGRSGGSGTSGDALPGQAAAPALSNGPGAGRGTGRVLRCGALDARRRPAVVADAWSGVDPAGTGRRLSRNGPP